MPLLTASCVQTGKAPSSEDRSDFVSASQLPAVQALAEDADFTRLLLERPPVPLTASREGQPAADRSDLPADGSEIIDRRCRITHRPQTGWYLLEFEPDPNQPAELPRWILPSPRLEQIEEELARSPQTIFRISGETTVYDGRVFLLLGKVSIERATKTAAIRPAEKQPTAETQPHDSPRTPEESSTSAILAKMRGERPDKPVLMTAKHTAIETVPSIAPAANVKPLDEDPSRIRVARQITLADEPGSEWKLARFISDNTLQDQPVRLLPCALLERAEELTARKKRQTVRLQITGLIVDYRGHRYMLLRKVLKERELGQF